MIIIILIQSFLTNQLLYLLDKIKKGNKMKNRTLIFSLLITASLFIGCNNSDGEMARQHNTISTFGDYYDHIVDNTYIIPVIIILYYKFRDHKNFHQLGIIFLLLTISSIMLVSCQEKIFWKNQKEYGRKQSISLSSLTGLCMTDNISKLRYFGLGLWHLYIFYLIVIN